jgi:hypothetical protein
VRCMAAVCENEAACQMRRNAFCLKPRARALDFIEEHGGRASDGNEPSFEIGELREQRLSLEVGRVGRRRATLEAARDRT